MRREQIFLLVCVHPNMFLFSGGPGTHCLHMRQSVPRFLVHRIFLCIPVRISLRNALIGCSRNRRLYKVIHFLYIVLIAKFMVSGASMILAKPRGR